MDFPGLSSFHSYHVRPHCLLPHIGNCRLSPLKCLECVCRSFYAGCKYSLTLRRPTKFQFRPSRSFAFQHLFFISPFVCLILTRSFLLLRSLTISPILFDRCSTALAPYGKMKRHDHLQNPFCISVSLQVCFFGVYTFQCNFNEFRYNTAVSFSTLLHCFLLSTSGPLPVPARHVDVSIAFTSDGAVHLRAASLSVPAATSVPMAQCLK